VREIVYFKIGYRQASGAFLALDRRAGLNIGSMQLAVLPTIRKGLARIAPAVCMVVPGERSMSGGLVRGWCASAVAGGWLAEVHGWLRC
jgi:hypothetical protein